MYVTGGVGAKHEGEAFGAPYELPNESAYAETCAAIGSALWNERMNLLSGDAKYADVVETATFNGILSGVSLAGDLFFYVNPLASKGNHHRQRWYDCACCPPNVVRFFASLPARIYATRGNDVYVNTYAASEASIGGLKISQKTNYPWDGSVMLTIDGDVTRLGALKLRIPGWCDKATVAVNYVMSKPAIENGYVTIARPWKAGDAVALHLPMPIRRVHADPRVKDDAGRVALARGPLIYCVEAVDENMPSTITLPRDETLSAETRNDLLGGVTVIKGKSLTAVPYFAWDNRAAGEMEVWINEDVPSAPR
jgi:DUF1680 family protein